MSTKINGSSKTDGFAEPQQAKPSHPKAPRSGPSKSAPNGVVAAVKGLLPQGRKDEALQHRREENEKRKTEEKEKWPPKWEEPWSADHLNHLLNKAGLTPGLIDQWASSPERSWYIGRRFYKKTVEGKRLRGIYFWVMVGLALILAGYLFAAFAEATNFLWWFPGARGFGLGVAILGAAVLGWCTVPYWAARRAFSARRRAAARYSVDEALEELRQAMETDESSKIQLARMFELNRRQLDEYQEITKN